MAELLTTKERRRLNRETLPVNTATRIGDRLRYLGADGTYLPGPTTRFHVDTTLGNDNNSGLSWDVALATINAAMALAAALGTRGRAQIFVAPGGYTEDVVTPLNTECPFGQLIAVNPTTRSFGGAYMIAATATEPTLTIKARGWLISGFEIGGPTTNGCVLLDGASANSNAAGTEISDCIIGGWGQATFGIDVTKNGAPHTILRNLHFNGIVGPAIKCSSSATDQPRFWEIDHCTFVDNSLHIAMTPRGFKESWIHDCTFLQNGANRSATLQLDNRGGSACAIGPNNFLSDTYDNAGGYYPGSDEDWYGNASEDGYTTANPAT